MAKLRKMLGDPTGPRAKALMALIDTQSASTLGRWAAAYAEERYLPTRRSMSVWRIWNSIGSSRHCGRRPLRMSRTLSRCGGTAETRLATPLTQITAQTHGSYSNAVNSSNAGPAMTPPTSVSSMPRNTIGRAGPSDQPC